MSDFLHFLLRHWILVSVFIVLFVMVVIEEARSKGLGGKASLNPQKLTHMINREDAFLLDIRDANAFKDSHIVGSTNIQQSTVEQNINKLNKHKNRPIVVIDPNGQKAVGVVNMLGKAGFEEVYFLSGGINAWKSANHPVVKK